MGVHASYRHSRPKAGHPHRKQVLDAQCCYSAFVEGRQLNKGSPPFRVTRDVFRRGSRGSAPRWMRAQRPSVPRVVGDGPPRPCPRTIELYRTLTGVGIDPRNASLRIWGAVQDPPEFTSEMTDAVHASVFRDRATPRDTFRLVRLNRWVTQEKPLWIAQRDVHGMDGNACVSIRHHRMAGKQIATLGSAGKIGASMREKRVCKGCGVERSTFFNS